MKLIKQLSWILTITLLVTILPTNILVTKAETTEEISQSNNLLTKNVGNVEHFTLGDMTYEELVYTELIRFLENEQWKETNNILSEINESQSLSGEFELEDLEANEILDDKSQEITNDDGDKENTLSNVEDLQQQTEEEDSSEGLISNEPNVEENSGIEIEEFEEVGEVEANTVFDEIYNEDVESTSIEESSEKIASEELTDEMFKEIYTKAIEQARKRNNITNSIVSYSMKNVYGNSIDIGIARGILGDVGYNYILTDQVGFVLPTFTSNDLIIGGAGATGGVGDVELNGAIRLWGANRDLTAEAIRNYVKSVAEPIKEGIKNVYGNSIDIGIAKGILGADGYNYILTDGEGFIIPTFTSNDIIVGGVGASGGVGDVELNGAIRLWGATRELTAEVIRNYVKTSISIKSMLSNFLLGIGDAGISAIDGVSEFLDHPVEKTKEMALAAAFLVTATQFPNSPEAKILNELISSMLKEAYTYNGDQWARFAGRCVGEILLGLIADKGINVAVESLRAFSQSGKLGVVLENLKPGDKIDDVLNELRGVAEAVSKIKNTLKTSVQDIINYVKQINKFDSYYEVITPDGQVFKIMKDEIPVENISKINNISEGALKGLGKIAGNTYEITTDGLNTVKAHLATFGEDAGNTAMIKRLESALANGEKLEGADASFYLHELKETELMANGIDYYTAHQVALDFYEVSNFSVYHPDVIKSLPAEFSDNWFRFWGLK